MSIFCCSVLLLPSPVPQAANVTSMLSSTGPASHELLVIADGLPSAAYPSPAVLLTISCDACVKSVSSSEASVRTMLAIGHACQRASDASAAYRWWCIVHSRNRLTRIIDGQSDRREGLLTADALSILRCTCGTLSVIRGDQGLQRGLHRGRNRALVFCHL